MATQSVAGFNGVMSVSPDGGTTWHPVGELTDYEVSWTQTMINATSHASGGHAEKIAGVDDWSATINALYIFADAGQADIQTALTSNAVLQFRFDPNGTGTGKPRITGTGIPSAWKVKSPLADINGMSCTVAGTAPLVWSIQ